MAGDGRQVKQRSFAALRMTEWETGMTEWETGMTEWETGTTEWETGMAEWVLPDEFVSVHNNNRNLMSGKG